MFCTGTGWFTCIFVVALIGTGYSNPYSITEWYPVMTQTDVKESTLWLNAGFQHRPEWYPVMPQPYVKEGAPWFNWGCQQKPEMGPLLQYLAANKGTPSLNWGFQHKPELEPLMPRSYIKENAPQLNWGSLPIPGFIPNAFNREATSLRNWDFQHKPGFIPNAFNREATSLRNWDFQHKPEMDLRKLFQDINEGYEDKPVLQPVMPHADGVPSTPLLYGGSQPIPEPLMPHSDVKEDAPQANQSSQPTPEPLMPHSDVKEDAQRSNQSSQPIPELKPVMPQPDVKGHAPQSNRTSQPIPEKPEMSPGLLFLGPLPCCTCDGQCNPGAYVEHPTSRVGYSQRTKGRCGCCMDCPYRGEATKSRGPTAAATNEALTNLWKDERINVQVFAGSSEGPSTEELAAMTPQNARRAYILGRRRK